jgi:hypothetical protein
LDIVTADSLARTTISLSHEDPDGHRDDGRSVNNAQETNNNNHNNSSNNNNNNNNSNSNSHSHNSGNRNRDNVSESDLNGASVIVGTDQSNLIVLQPSTTAAYTSMLPSFGHYSAGKLCTSRLLPHLY